jgi:hypothetical protein
METISFTATARVRRPQSNVIDFNDYRRALKTEQPAKTLSTNVTKNTKSRSVHRRLSAICLILEACVCVSLLLLTLAATLRFLFL